MRKHKGKTVFINVILFCVCILCAVPFYLMIVMTTKTSAQIYSGDILWFGSNFLNNLKVAVEAGLMRAYVNSCVVSVTSTFICVLVSAMAGYALSKFSLRGKGFVLKCVLMTMMIPSYLSLVAYVIQMNKMGLIGTLLPLIFPWVASPFGVFWMTQFIGDAVPTEVLESARVDGATEIHIFLRFVLNYIKSAVVTLALLIFLWSWNNYLLPMIIINSEEQYTIPLMIAKIGTFFNVDHASRITALALGTIPLVLMFGLGQKYFIQGLTSGAVKE